MTHTAAVLLLALGASADVPAWVQKKSSLNMPSMESIMAPVLSLQNRVTQQTPNSRRLQAITSAECESACPGVQDMVQAMMEMATQTTTPPPAGVDPSVAMMMSLCDYADTIVCAATTDACKEPGDGGSGDETAMMKCICACPKLATLGDDAEAMCSNRADTIDCMTSQSSCDSLVQGMGGAAAADIQCKMVSAGCKEKVERMDSCEGLSAWTRAGCEELADNANLASKKDTCCPEGVKIIACITKECMDLQLAAVQLQADAGSSEASRQMSKNFEIGKVCTDTGMPKSKADVQATIDNASGGSSGGGSTSAAPSQAAPVLAMIAAIVALVT